MQTGRRYFIKTAVSAALLLGPALSAAAYQSKGTVESLYSSLKDRPTPLFLPMPEDNKSYVIRINHFNSDGYRFVTMSIAELRGDFRNFSALSNEEKTARFEGMPQYEGFWQFGNGPLGTDENDAYLNVGKDGSYTTREKGKDITQKMRDRFEEIAVKYIIGLAK